MSNTLFPACYVELPTSCEGKRAAFYLAAEEYIASALPEDNYLFSWQLGPTVVMGRNQIAAAEIDLDFCMAEGIDVIRRKSGGGTIYADRGNIMLSLVTGRGAVEPLFKQYAHTVAKVLNRLGAPVEATGRNDIVLRGGGKICGNAFYHLSDRNIVHGTMLYDTNQRLMSGALTPERAKLLSKGVKSVESRIGLLKNHLPNAIDATALRLHLREALTNRSLQLTEDDVQYIKAIEADYYDPIFIHGKEKELASTQQPACSVRIEGCGTIRLQLSTNENMVESLSISGDFFEEGNAQEAFEEAFCGCPLQEEALIDAAERCRPDKHIRGMELPELIYLLKALFP